MNSPIISQHNTNSYVVYDYGSLNEISINQEDFWEYYQKIVEEIEILKADNRSAELMSRLIDRLNYISNIVKIQESWELEIENIESLKHLQKLTVSWYINFLIWSFLHENKTWYIVMPTGQWKTIITLLLSSLNPNNSIIISDNNIWKEQFLSEASRVKNIEGNNFTIDTLEENTDKVIIWWWDNLFKSIENQTINFNKYSTIFIDEADVNWLSDKRQDILNKLINEFWINVIWLSATQEQASWKKLYDFYEYDILNFPMPESLPELFKINEIPNIHFKDVFLNSDLSVKNSKLEWNDNEIDHFIKNSDWIRQMFEYHMTNNIWKKFILWMRNNSLNKSILKVASEKWLRLAELVGDTAQEERTKIIEQLKSWKIDGIIWCKLTWRGLDIPECKVVYNSLLTYSPQLFWQLGWRAARFDVDNPWSEKEIVTFLPKNVHKIDNVKLSDDNNLLEKNVKSEKSKTRVSLPLSFQAFFNSKYFSDVNDQVTDDKVFSLSDLNKDQIKSIPDVATQLEWFNTYGSFSWRPEVLAKIILSYRFDLTYAKLKYLLKIKSKESMDDFFSENNNIFSGTNWNREKLVWKYLSYIDIYKSKKIWSLTISEEKKLFKNYFETQDKKIKWKLIEKILGYHYEIIIALACKMQTDNIWIDDLIQAGIEYLLENFEKFKPINRFSSFCSTYAFKGIQDYIQNNASDIRIPVHVQRIQNRVQKIIPKYEQIKNLDSHVSQQDMVTFISRELGLTNEKVIEVLNSYNKYQEFDESEIIIHESWRQYKWYDWVPIWALTHEREWMDPVLDELYKDILYYITNDALACLRSKEAQAIRMLYGIDMNNEYTLAEVWEQFDVSWWCISQIKVSALRKLRHPSRSVYLETFINENDIDYTSRYNDFLRSPFTANWSLEHGISILDIIRKEYEYISNCINWDSWNTLFNLLHFPELQNSDFIRSLIEWWHKTSLDSIFWLADDSTNVFKLMFWPSSKQELMKQIMEINDSINEKEKEIWDLIHERNSQKEWWSDYYMYKMKNTTTEIELLLSKLNYLKTDLNLVMNNIKELEEDTWLSINELLQQNYEEYVKKAKWLNKPRWYKKITK